MINWTEEQARAINLRGKNILVSASAGSGKTTVMVERAVSLLSEGVKLTEMLIVTFTKAAAADMKEKLSKKLFASQDIRVREQLNLLARTDICTLHSFCKKLIGEYFYAVGADPEFGVLEEGEKNSLLNKSIDAALKQEAESGDVDFLELSGIFGDTRGDRRLKELVRESCEAARLLPRKNKSLVTAAEYKTLLTKELDLKKDALFKKIDLLERLTNEAGFARNYEAVNALKTSVLLKNIPSAPKGRIEPCFAELNESYKTLKAQAVKLIDCYLEAEKAGEGSGKYLDVIDRIVDKTDEIFAKQKESKGKLDFSDLEHYALKILHSAEASQIQSKYKFIFVDEYQDINPLQDEIISLLHKDNYLFLVGDIKQSIYAFRGCEPTIFAEKYCKFKEDLNAEVIELNANHRSKDGILRLNNQIFSEVMTSDFGSTDYKSTAQFITGQDKEDCISVHFADKDEEEGGEVLQEDIYDITKPAVSSSAQADKAVQCVLDILRNKTVDENGKLRPAKYGDIAILTRSYSPAAAEVYARLMSLDVPCAAAWGQNKGDLFCAPLINYLKLINNALNDCALINSLKSHIGQFTDNQLAEIRLASPDAEYFYAAALNYPAQDGIKQKLTAFFDKLNHYRRLSYSVSAAELCGKIVAESEYFQHLFTKGGGAAAAMEQFLRRAEDFSGAGLYEFLEYLQTSALLNVEAEDNAVKIMTVHGSKGLEFPYVLLLDIQKRFNLTDASSPVLIYKGTAAIKYYDWDLREAKDSAGWLYNAAKISKRQREEELRLLYVALTRAKYGLYIFSGKTPPARDAFFNHAAAVSWQDWLAPFCAEYSSQKYDGLLAQKTAKAEPPPPSPELVKLLKQKFNSAKDTPSNPPKSYVTALIHDGEEGESRSYLTGGGDDRAMETGNRYHKIMELISFEGDFEEQWDSLNADLKQDVKKGDILKCVSSVKELIGGATYFKEQGFMLRQDGGMLVQGVIDLLIVKGGEGIIVDYKTGQLNEGYKKQLDYYALAAESVLKLKIRKKLIYSFKNGTLTEV